MKKRTSKGSPAKREALFGLHLETRKQTSIKEGTCTKRDPGRSGQKRVDKNKQRTTKTSRGTP